MKKYYKVIGFPLKENVILGYTTSKKAFTSESVKNGWKAKDLLFIKQ